MRIAICYSGQLRCCRVTIKTHINYLLIPLLNEGYLLDIFFYTDIYNTSRNSMPGNKIKWDREDLDLNILNYFKQKINIYANYFEIQMNENVINYDINNYSENLSSQLKKFNHVLNMAKKYSENNNFNYNLIIRLRPDICFIDQIYLNSLDSNFVYQNRENPHNYNGDAIQIFNGKYLTELLNLTSMKINNIKIRNHEIYEDIINYLFLKLGLKLKWIDNLCHRWIDKCSSFYDGLELKYFNDWISKEYKYNFSIEEVQKNIEIRKNTQNILNGNDYNYDIGNNIDLLYLSALDPDISKYCFKDVIGLIPCSGTASRINNIPKFLLPCKEGNLLDNTIKIFQDNNIDNIYISVSSQNKDYIEKRNIINSNIKYIVKDTETMSETVSYLTNFTANKYILIMPDTYFITSDNKECNNYYFKELKELYIKLFKYKIVVVLWKIKESQYGKLGQISIDKNKVIDIIDKDPNCRYPYSWGIIGWNKDLNKLIDIKTPHIGYLLNSALKENIDIGYVISNSEYFDCGTKEEYFDMIKKYT